MLNKSPDERPTSKEVIRTEYVVKHISKLLSYTLQKKDGGAKSNGANSNKAVSNAMLPNKSYGDKNSGDREGVPAPGVIDDSPSKYGEERVLDPEVAERRIEVERSRQKEADIKRKKETQEAKVYH